MKAKPDDQLSQVVLSRCVIFHISGQEDIIPKFLLSLWYKNILKQEATQDFQVYSIKMLLKVVSERKWMEIFLCDSCNETVELMKIAIKWWNLQKVQRQSQEASDQMLSDTELPESISKGLRTDLICCHHFQKSHWLMMETANMSLNILGNEYSIRDRANIARRVFRTKEIKQYWVLGLRLLCLEKNISLQMEKNLLSKILTCFTFKSWYFFSLTGIDFNQVYLGCEVKQTNEQRQLILPLTILIRYTLY